LKEGTLARSLSNHISCFHFLLLSRCKSGTDRASGRYTEYQKTEAEVWDEAFAEPELVLWLALQKRGASAAPE
jgi:hypothetical protein